MDPYRGQVLYAKEDKIRSINIADDSDETKFQSKDELSLDYLPKCFHLTNGGFMVTGGLMTPTSKFKSNGIPHLTQGSASFSAAAPAQHSSSTSPLSSHTQMLPLALTQATASAGQETLFNEYLPSKSSPISPLVSLDGNPVSKAGSAKKYSIASYSSRSSKGILSFHNPELNESHTVALGGMINNAVTIYQNSLLSYTSYICNNDSNLYVVDIDQSRKLSLDRTINCELNTSLNNVVRCPKNQKVLTVTGDLSSVFLVDPTSSNSKIATIKTKHDSGFGMSYHPNGTTFAVSFQDGSCLLYDIRNLPKSGAGNKKDSEALLEFKSTRAGHQNGAFRCCKFSQTGLNDLLVISEHVGRVHLIDLQKASSSSSSSSAGHQVMVLPYALDQYSNFKRQKISGEHLSNKNEETEKDDETTSNHYKIPIYDDSDIVEDFPAPLVYDYDYLVNVNPHIFKDYSYQPDSEEYGKRPYLPSPELNIPNQNHMYPGGMGSGMVSEDDYDFYNESSPRSSGGDRSGLDILSYPGNDHITANASQINGEINLSGIDWYGEKLLVGCQDGGILTWDMNTRGRNCSGNFSYA